MSLRRALYGYELDEVEKKLLELTGKSKFAHTHDEKCRTSPDYCISKQLTAVLNFLMSL